MRVDVFVDKYAKQCRCHWAGCNEPRDFRRSYCPKHEGEEMTPPDINVADVVAEAEAYKDSHYLDANKQYSIKLDKVLVDLLAAVKQLQDESDDIIAELRKENAGLLASCMGLEAERDTANERVAELEGKAVDNEQD